MEQFLGGLAYYADPLVVAMLFLGIVVGFVFGVLPGLGAVNATVLFLPFVYGMKPAAALAFIAALMGSNLFGGSLTAIFINTPGTGANAATTMDGYQMTKRGESLIAVGISGAASLAGGTIGILVLIALLPIMSSIVLLIGAPELFMLCMLGICCVSVAVGGNILKGLAAAGVGLLISFIGFDPISGVARFAFGTRYLWDGLQFMPAFIGLFGLCEMLDLAGKKVIASEGIKEEGSVIEGIKEFFRHKACFVRSSLIGVIIGIIPGIGGATANWFSYMVARQVSKTADTYGKGNPEGVVASETANNASCGGDLVPTIAFGIPGSAEMAVLLGAFILLGIQPGPMMMIQHMNVLWVLILGVVIAHVITSLLGLIWARPLSRIAFIDVKYIIPAVVMFCFVGAYSIKGSVIDVLVSLGFGFAGWVMRKTGFPVIPMVIGLVLGGITEEAFNHSMLVKGGGALAFVTHPIALGLLLLNIFLLMLPFIRKPTKGTQKELQS